MLSCFYYLSYYNQCLDHMTVFLSIDIMNQGLINMINADSEIFMIDCIPCLAESKVGWLMIFWTIAILINPLNISLSSLWFNSCLPLNLDTVCMAMTLLTTGRVAIYEIRDFSGSI